MNKLLKIPVDRPGGVYVNPAQVVRVTAFRHTGQSEYTHVELSDGETFTIHKPIGEVAEALGCELDSRLER